MRVNFLEIDLPRPWHWFAFVFREFDGYEVEAGVKQPMSDPVWNLPLFLHCVAPDPYLYAKGLHVVVERADIHHPIHHHG